MIACNETMAVNGLTSKSTVQVCDYHGAICLPLDFAALELSNDFMVLLIDDAARTFEFLGLNDK